MMKKYILSVMVILMICVSAASPSSDLFSKAKAAVSNLSGTQSARFAGCIHQNPGDLCADPIVIDQRSWTGQYDLCDFCNDYDLEPCTGWPSNAPDMVFEVDMLQENNFLRAIVTPTAFWDISLAVISQCGLFYSSSCLDGEDDQSSGYIEAAYLTGLPAGTYYIIVSGYQMECGTFDIAVESDCELPVELVSFEALPGNQEARLMWVTASETNNDHFYLLRSTDRTDFARISNDIPATNSANGHSYSYLDQGLINGTTYYYKLVDVDINGIETVNSIIAETSPSPEHSISPLEYGLRQNFPNPFNPKTTIAYDIKEEGFVTLTVYDIMGREIMTLVNDHKAAGSYSLTFDASKLASGIYLYRLSVNGFSDMKKMVVLK
jgi:hypothetical protein